MYIFLIADYAPLGTTSWVNSGLGALAVYFWLQGKSEHWEKTSSEVGRTPYPWAHGKGGDGLAWVSLHSPQARLGRRQQLKQVRTPARTRSFSSAIHHAFVSTACAIK